MKIIEENLLKNTILQLNNYLEEHKHIETFYENLSSLKMESLQSFSFQQDNEFFGEVSFILSVIHSIIAHPHISNKGEDVILRSNQAGHLSRESFKKTFRESSLWKEKDLEMIPEYVHYHQYTDELKIYENIFIGMLIDLIDIEITKYNEFYIRLLPSLNNKFNKVIMANHQVEQSLNRLDKIERKMKYIKNTYFYKEVSKVHLSQKKIQPTNILLKNRLYNLCFKFYRKFIQYENKMELEKDFRLYYYFTILKVLKKKNFILDTSKDNFIEPSCSNLTFHFRDYICVLKFNEEPGIYLEISLKEDLKRIFKHRLLLDTSRNTKETHDTRTDAITTYIASIWNLVDVTDFKEIFINNVSEKEIITFWIDSLFYESIAKKEIYTKYCPICKSKNIDQQDLIYKCSKCNSIYTFKPNEEKDIIWFIHLRR